MNKLKLAVLVVMAVSFLAVGSCTMFQTAKNVLCNPTDQQKAEAQAAAAFLDIMASNIGGPVGLVYLGAKEVFLLVRAGICVDSNQLSEAISTLDEAESKALIKGVKTGGFPKVESLRTWVKQ